MVEIRDFLEENQARIQSLCAEALLGKPETGMQVDELQKEVEIRLRQRGNSLSDNEICDWLKNTARAEATEAFVKRNKSRIEGICGKALQHYGLTENREDLVGDVQRKLYENWDSLKRDLDVWNWLSTCVYREAVDLYRRHRPHQAKDPIKGIPGKVPGAAAEKEELPEQLRPVILSCPRRPHQAEDPLEEIPGKEPDPGAAAEKQELRKALEELPEKLRRVIWFHYFLNLTLDEIARHLSLPLGTIKTRHREAKIKLQPLLRNFQ